MTHTWKRSLSVLMGLAEYLQENRNCSKSLHPCQWPDRKCKLQCFWLNKIGLRAGAAGSSLCESIVVAAYPSTACSADGCGYREWEKETEREREGVDGWTDRSRLQRDRRTARKGNTQVDRQSNRQRQIG